MSDLGGRAELANRGLRRARGTVSSMAANASNRLSVDTFEGQPAAASDQTATLVQPVIYKILKEALVKHVAASET